MHMGCLLIVCSYCCLHLNPIWSELSPRSSPHPQSSAAWWQRFPLRRFLFVALRGLSPLSLQNDSECLRLVNPAAGAREAREKGRRGCPQPRARRDVPPLSGAATAGLQFASPGCGREARSLPQPLPGLLGQYNRYCCRVWPESCCFQKPQIKKKTHIFKKPHRFSWSAPRWGRWATLGFQEPAPR